ncbi:hypothetical protein AVEN_218306-1, partial [Araneus ventricosus]
MVNLPLKSTCTMSETTVKMISNKLTDDGSRNNLLKKVGEISNLLAYMDDDSK